MKINIDPEFSAIIPPLKTDEYEQLEKNILADGCRDPLVLWNDIIVDGHNRYEICAIHGIDYQTVNMNFDNREDVIIWICQNQRGRRNIHSEQWDYLLGKEYEMTKRKVGNPNFSQLDQNGQIGNDSKSTRKILVEKHGLSEGTIQRANYFAQGVDAIGKVSEIAKEKILSGKENVPKGVIQNVRNMTEQEIELFAKSIENDIVVEPKSKICRVCKKEKPIEDFNISKKSNGKAWRRTECKVCSNSMANGSKNINAKGEVYKSNREAEELFAKNANGFIDSLYSKEQVEYTTKDLENELYATIYNMERNISATLSRNKSMIEDNKQNIIAVLSEAESAIHRIRKEYQL